MLRAAAALADGVRDVLAERGAVPGRVLVLAGSGDNGGDALHAAASLAAGDVHVTVVRTGSRWHEEGWAAAARAGATVAAPEDAARVAAGCDVVLDGIVGIGTSGGSGLRGTARDVVAAIRSVLGSRGPTVVAVDIPSGVGPDDGTVSEPVLPADLTVTFGAIKVGLMREPGSRVAGRVVLVDLGLGPYLGEPVLRAD
jgi:hydroxyethylthiazole kinase-like uncharacterized protein yjeF